jgi:flagellar protein FliS
MSENTSANAYLKTKVMTAPPEELRLMLLDGSIRFARMALEGLTNKDHEKTFEGFTNCRNIVLELGDSVKPGPDPVLAQNMKGIYTFIYGELVKASFNKDTKVLEKAIELLEYERDTWALFIEKLEQERAEGFKGAAPESTDAPQQQPVSRLSIQA